MPTDEETLHDGPIYKFVRKRYHWREPEFWEALKAEVVRQSDAAGLLADIEDDLRGFLSRQSTLREETREDRERAAFGPAKAGPGGVTERRICEMGLIATFSEQPTFRAEAAIDVLQSLPGVRRFLEQHPDAGYGFVAGFAMGLTMEMLRVMEHEPDTGLGQQPRVRHSGRLWSAARLDETAQSPGVVGSFAVRTDGGVESRCWYADLEPECFSASALKLEAILAGLAAVDGPRDRAEVWRPSGWYRDAVPSLGTETLRKARLRGAELSARMSGNQWEYEVGSVIRHWPQYAALVQEALRAEEPAT
jgi:hypothetical protein